MTDNDERLTMPGQPPTDEDLRQDADLARQELAETVAALGEKADVKARVQRVAHEKAEELRERGDELVGKLPEPVATRVRPVVTGATDNPLIPIAGLIAFLLVLRFLLKRRAAR
jgi:LPXTG-motif cell wall-anchored protein